MTNLIPFIHRRKGGLANRQDYLYNMLDDFFNEGMIGENEFLKDSFALDVEREEGQYVVSAELPGVKKDEISLDFHDGNLIISVVTEEEKSEEDKNYIYRERQHKSASRSVYLHDGVGEGIKAKLDDGVLKITVPRVKQVEDKKVIEIE